jgi:hypothetical protein
MLYSSMVEQRSYKSEAAGSIPAKATAKAENSLFVFASV